MKFFTREMWLALQSGPEMPDFRAHRDAFARYEEQLSALCPRLGEKLFEFFSKADLHDAELVEVSVMTAVQGSYDAEVGDESPVQGRIKVAGSDGESSWTLLYRGVRKAVVDFPGESPLFFAPGDGFGDLGYHELSDAGEGFLRHEILFSSGATLLFEFREVEVLQECIQERIGSVPE